MKKVWLLIFVCGFHSFFSCSQSETGSDNPNYFKVIKDLDYKNPLKQRITSSIEAFCNEFGRPPLDVTELLEFCVEADYADEDMILDDFKINLLRVREDYNGFFVVYFIGPDFVDNQCEKILFQEDIDKLDFDMYLKFKGDIILGGIENEVIQLYREKFLKSGG
ncbi:MULTISPECIES: hypothetical protein [unclassified Imperialibacter]|uniref:hypothetical protein n=1 Tax=unclassified Imperialibacter TaxID=2629706 RepID=UPI0012546FC4|nr:MULTISPECIES: hypothetical protein [unclassified Imperialibacter]CAD5290535.1 exported hypothetical protein [Imperialibacter sp. 89]CAD5290811.1 exported hypothetical protein [Imperialibacter sp. 75]VVT34452.1 exported hypothetical protein [Imperialibacter sp. EC-SDR9]